MAESDPLTAGLLFRVPARPRVKSTPSSCLRRKPKVSPIQLADSPAPSTSSLPTSTLKQLRESNPVPLAVRAATAALRAAHRDSTNSQASPAVTEGMVRAAEDVYHTPVPQRQFLPLTPISGDRDGILRTHSDISSVKAANSLGRADTAERIELFGRDDAYRTRLYDHSFLKFDETPSVEHTAKDLDEDFQNATLGKRDNLRREKEGGVNDSFYPKRTAKRPTQKDPHFSHRSPTKHPPKARQGRPTVARHAFWRKGIAKTNVDGRFDDADEADLGEDNDATQHAAKRGWEDEEDVITPVPDADDERKVKPKNSPPPHLCPMKEDFAAREGHLMHKDGAFVKYETTVANMGRQVQDEDGIHVSEGNDATHPATKYRWENDKDVTRGVPATNSELAPGEGEHVKSGHAKYVKREKERNATGIAAGVLDSDDSTQSAKISPHSCAKEIDEPKKHIADQKIASRHKRRHVAKQDENPGPSKKKRGLDSRMTEVLRLQKSLETARWTNAKAVREQTEVILLTEIEPLTAARGRGANRRTARRASTGSRYIKKEKVSSRTGAPTASQSRRRRARSERKRPKKLRTPQSSSTARPGENVNANGNSANAVTEAADSVSRHQKAVNSATPRAVTAPTRLGKRTRASTRREETQPIEREEVQTTLQRTRGRKAHTLSNNVNRKRRRSARLSEGAVSTRQANLFF
eukprot:GFKZ01009315.1.p1 GENE.GFKZ01009315.1~~GFKZ01009315.1.p1  ORF type:complete len:733 (+),score=91.54 GFKZ01009315.1:115-2199(+)